MSKITMLYSEVNKTYGIGERLHKEFLVLCTAVGDKRIQPRFSSKLTRIMILLNKDRFNLLCDLIAVEEKR